MNEPGFTKGPWHVIETGIAVTVRAANDENIYHESDKRVPRVMADAHLIAASPRLYSALENLCDSINWTDLECVHPKDLADMEKRFNEALAALDQARGKV